MSLLEAIILGIVQGATEFLPISSSGHSYLVPALFGLREPSLQEVAIAHLGTLLAVIVYFFRDIVAIVQGVLQGLIKRKPFGNDQARLGWYIVAGSIPAAVIGLLFEDQFDQVFGTARFAAGFLIVTATLLILGERMLSGKKSIQDMSWADAIIIGLFQMVALFPGVSRSGSTIVGGLWRGLSRELAARYSFLMSIPVILGAGLLGIFDLVGSGNFDLGTLAVLFFSSFGVGLACIHYLLRWLRNRNLYPFAIYCALFGLLFLIFS